MIALRKSKLSDPDMQAVPAALARAAKSARELAKKTATSLVIAHDGLVIQVSPDESQNEAKQRLRADNLQSAHSL